MKVELRKRMHRSIAMAGISPALNKEG